MGAVGGEGPPQFLSTHPSPGNRQEKLGELVPKVAPFYEAARGKEVPTYTLRETLATP
jgi:predicted Zn-dependent protease